MILHDHFVQCSHLRTIICWQSGNICGLSHTKTTLLLCEVACSSAIVQETLFEISRVFLLCRECEIIRKYIWAFSSCILLCGEFSWTSSVFLFNLLLIYLFTTVMLLRGSCETRRADQILKERLQQSKEEYYFLEQTDECYVSSREDRSMQSNSLLSTHRLHKQSSLSSCSLSCSHLYVDPSVTKFPSALKL